MALHGAPSLSEPGLLPVSGTSLTRPAPLAAYLRIGWMDGSFLLTAGAAMVGLVLRSREDPGIYRARLVRASD
jgi:hypothetical protein